MEEPLEFKARLLVNVKLLKPETKIVDAEVFEVGSIQTVVASPRNKLHIKGYPSTTLIDQAWEPVFDWEDIEQWK